MNLPNFVNVLAILACLMYSTNVSSQTILINEIMANPTNSLLPNQEYIELYNAGEISLNLKDYRYSVGSNSQTLPDYFLAPKQHVVLVSAANVSEFERYGNSIGLSRWFTLTNTGTSISLHDPNNRLVDSVFYQDDWYQDGTKDNGGWSLERINPVLTCQSETNWMASLDYQGGTPGKRNSVYDEDFFAELTILETEVTDNTVKLIFNQTINLSLYLLNEQIALSPSLGNILAVDFLGNDTLSIQFSSNFLENEPYTLGLNDVEFCGNRINLSKTIFISDPINYNDVIINEVLFNPRADGVDFVELFNNSNAIINLEGWLLGNRVISSGIHLFYPNEYRVLTSNIDNIKLNYPSAVVENMIQLVSLPAYSNEQGIVTIYSPEMLSDSLYYSSDYHLQLLDDPDGISLERQGANLPTNGINTFTSASTLSEGATPGYENSKNSELISEKNSFFLSSKTFSPDLDNFQDFLEMNYELSQGNLMINAYIFNDKGNLVNRLIRNQNIGTKGIITWDGKSENKQDAADGIYIFYIELYSEDGVFETYKESFVLVRKGISY
ncbi:lamin tail domain-containing protein [Sphingobacterium hungaricum]